MKTIIPFLFGLFCIVFQSAAQTAELCQGAYFTEEEGKAFLEKHKVSSRVEWEARAEKIRKQIRDGMDLNTLPEKPN